MEVSKIIKLKEDVSDKKLEKYGAIYNFYDGLAKVLDKETGLYGYINTYGFEVIPCEYHYATDFSEGVAVVKKQNMCRDKEYCINTENEIISKIGHEKIYPCKDGKILTVDGGIYTFYNKDFSVCTNQRFTFATSFSKGFARGHCKKKAYLINSNGATAYLGKNYSVKDFDEDYAIIEDTKTNLYGLINKKAQFIFPCIFEELKYCKSEKLYFGYKKSHLKKQEYCYGYLEGIMFDCYIFKDDEKKYKELANIYEKEEKSVQNALFNNGLQVARIGNLYGIIDEKGNIVIPFNYEHISMNEHIIILYPDVKLEKPVYILVKSLNRKMFMYGVSLENDTDVREVYYDDEKIRDEVYKKIHDKYNSYNEVRSEKENNLIFSDDDLNKKNICSLFSFRKRN